MVKVALFVLFTLLIIDCGISLSNYGPFNITLTKVSVCSGPKRKDCSINTVRIVNRTIMDYSMNVKDEIKDVHGHITALAENKHTVRMQMNKLCEHPFWLPYVKKFINITKDCVILKGNYRMVSNMQETAQKYFGGSFLYGKWIFKSVMFSDTCNFGCLNVESTISPK